MAVRRHPRRPVSLLPLPARHSERSGPTFSSPSLLRRIGPRREESLFAPRQSKKCHPDRSRRLFLPLAPCLPQTPSSSFRTERADFFFPSLLRRVGPRREESLFALPPLLRHTELRPEYDLSKRKAGVRGKYLARYRAGTNLVLLSADVAEYFPDEQSVNTALRRPQFKACATGGAKTADPLGICVGHYGTWRQARKLRRASPRGRKIRYSPTFAIQ